MCNAGERWVALGCVLVFGASVASAGMRKQPTSIYGGGYLSSAQKLTRFLFLRAAPELHGLLGVRPDSPLRIKSVEPWKKGKIAYLLERKEGVDGADIPVGAAVHFDSETGVVRVTSKFGDGQHSEVIANKISEGLLIVKKQIVLPFREKRKITLHRVNHNGVRTRDLDNEKIVHYVIDENGPILLRDVDELLDSLEL